MIPVRLELKNFLPYRSPDPLRFDGIHLACLTGPNGAGKSSLLDAITWALWGKARAKRDEELVHLGQGDMYVQLDFEQEGSIYRVLRRRSRGRRSGQGALDLFILKADGSPTTITEPSMRTTQDKINTILRLDYETFVHSAFLQQGKADAFTTKSPAERKKILSDILGLDQWIRYEDAVKGRLKTITNNLHYFEQRIQEIDTELARKPNLEADLEAAQTSHEEAQAALKTAEERLQEVEHAPGELRNAQDNKANRERRLREHQRDMEEAETRIERQREQIADYQQVIEAREEIETGYAALQSARNANKALSEKLLKLKSLDDERYELRSKLENTRTRLESEAENIRSRITELEATTDTNYAEELDSVQAEVTELLEMEAERDQLEGEANRLREERARIEGELSNVTAEGQALRDRLERLEAADDETATCPLCGQPLDAEHRARLIDQLQGEVEMKRDEYRRNQDRIAEISNDVQSKKALLDEFGIELKRLSPLMERVGVLQTQQENAAQAETRLEEERTRLEAVLAELENETFAPDVREELARLEARQAELDYDRSSHDEAQQQLQQHDHYDQLHTRLTIALESLPSLELSVEDARARQDRLREAIAETETEIAELDSEITRLTELVEEYRTREAEVRTQRTQERTAYERVVSARQALDALEKQAERKEELEARRDHAREEEALYDELKRAFGKNGIPAMIIETAIPELEATANDLLARMTDGRMHLRLNTQREKVTGGVAETLDIEIADELGTRSYELYSGGEAFRINFAIRVALSQMLARRAGAHLRTLFIDEGFGTQDDAGRSKLVEAINAIQEEFSMVLVITHIDELRDSFPVHIVVDKTPTGSRLNVL